jgi:hypothetical protein
MKKLIFTILVLAFLPLSNLFSQPVIYSEGFETYDTTTLPTGWYKFYNTGEPNDILANWTVRDSGTAIPGCGSLSKAYQSKKSMVVTWWMLDSNSIADAWLVTKKFGALPTDALLSFYACGGTNGAPPYSDSIQILISPTGDTAVSSFQYLETKFWPTGSIFGNFQQYFIDLSTFAGTTPRIAFRYYMDCTTMGYAVLLDKVELLGTVGISQLGNNIPKKFALSQNYPNPFNPTTKIKFDVPKNGNVTLEVFNNLGQVVSTLHNGYTNAGYYETSFDGSRLTSGIYFYRMTTPDFVMTKKMILVK